MNLGLAAHQLGMSFDLRSEGQRRIGRDWVRLLSEEFTLRHPAPGPGLLPVEGCPS